MTLRVVARSRPARYLVVGALNTAFGYSAGVGLYYLLSPQFHIVAIGLLANVMAISFSFITYKLLVFRTHGHWLAEYMRSYVVYGGMALLGIGLLWIFVDGLRVTIWMAQGLVIAMTVAISYLGHSRYTFRNPKDMQEGRPT